MGYSTLKAALDAVVRTNGRQQITGANLNNVMTTLLQGVDVMDRANPADTSGMNHVVLKSNKTFAEQVTGSNTIYEIRDSFDLGGSSFTIPTGCVLYFNGGQVNNGVLVGTNTMIQSNLSHIFGVTLSGTWMVEHVFPEWFGAKGDGVTDDSTALTKCLSAPIKDVILSRNYLLTQNISIAESKNIRGNMSLIKASNVDYAFEVRASNVEVSGLKISGENTSIGGVKVTNSAKGVFIHNCEFYNFYSSIASGGQANGVFVDAYCEDVTLKSLNIHNIDAEKNGVAGDVSGSCQGILISKVTNCLVEGCYIHDINNTEDGEGIQVFSTKVDNVWTQSDVTIRNCYIYNVAKRMIKAQCLGITIEDCVLVSDDENIVECRAIDLFGADSRVCGCFIKTWNPALITTPALGNEISNCEIINETTSSSPNYGTIFVTSGTGEVTIKGNKIQGGWACIFVDSSATPVVNILENIILPATLFGIRSTGTATLKIIGNLFASSNSVRHIAIPLDSSKVISGNVLWSGLYGIYNASSSVSAAKIDNNIFIGQTQAKVYDTIVPRSLNGDQIRRNFYGDGTTALTSPSVGDHVLWERPTEFLSKVRCFDGKWRRIPLISDVETHGTTADRPTASSAGVGFTYFDTDLGKMIVSTGSAWVNMDGSALS